MKQCSFQNSVSGVSQCRYAHWLAAKANELLAAYDAAQPAVQLRTYEQTEHLWDTVIRPALPSFRTMQDLWTGDPPPEDSVWRENWRVPKIS